MSEMIETEIVIVCPNCQHFAFKLENYDPQSKIKITQRCRRCKEWFSFPADSAHITRKMIRNTH